MTQEGLLHNGIYCAAYIKIKHGIMNYENYML